MSKPLDAYDPETPSSMKSIAVSGPRKVREGTSEAKRVEQAVLQFLQDGYDILVGGAVGVDLIAVKTVLANSDAHRLKVYLPCSYERYRIYMEAKLRDEERSQDPDKEIRVAELKGVLTNLDLVYGQNSNAFDCAPDDLFPLEKEKGDLRRDAFDEVNQRMVDEAHGAMAVSIKGGSRGTGDFYRRASDKFIGQTAESPFILQQVVV